MARPFPLRDCERIIFGKSDDISDASCRSPALVPGWLPIVLVECKSRAVVVGSVGMKICNCLLEFRGSISSTIVLNFFDLIFYVHFQVLVQ